MKNTILRHDYIFIKVIASIYLSCFCPNLYAGSINKYYSRCNENNISVCI